MNNIGMFQLIMESAYESEYGILLYDTSTTLYLFGIKDALILCSSIRRGGYDLDDGFLVIDGVDLVD